MGDKSVFLNGGNGAKFSREFVESLSKIFFDDWYIMEEQKMLNPGSDEEKKYIEYLVKKYLSGLSS